ncbi:alpha/beta fold hydrolase [Algoriphagus namhaensis]|uniref:Alpha/beta fold hydrolase n=1 Tax=Algoriphagus namhaensis TaxID=915353 RepID=A0ABV8ARE0_9BACT
MSFLSSPWGKLFYEREGQGQNVTLLFHGFGQSHEDMLEFGKIRSEADTFIYIDMFYHGRSVWNNPEVELTRTIWVKIITLLQEQESFSKFHLIGFSMGGKISLLTFELMPERVESLLLIGPDGIKTGKWYSTANYPTFISPLFKRLIFKPKRVFRIFEGLQKAGMVEKSIHKFITTQMETRSKRAQIFFVWKVFGRIQLDLGQIIKNARKTKTPIRICIGEYDAMITKANMNRFLEKLPHATLTLFPVGHGQLIQATVAEDLKKQP